MYQAEKEIKTLYERCGVPKDLNHPVTNELYGRQLNNKLHSDKSALNINSAFSYSACGASSVGLDWLNQNGHQS